MRVPEEIRLSTISLEKIVRLSSAGTTIAPYMPAFYDISKGISAMFNFKVS